MWLGSPCRRGSIHLYVSSPTKEGAGGYQTEGFAGLFRFVSRLSDVQLQLEATNTGERNVVSSFGFRLPDGNNMFLMDPGTKSFQSLPHELPPHRSCLVADDMRTIAESLAGEGYFGRVKLVGFCRDLEGTEFLSSSWNFDVNQWLRRPVRAGAPLDCHLSARWAATLRRLFTIGFR